MPTMSDAIEEALKARDGRASREQIRDTLSENIPMSGSQPP
jgi:hypothetical protein